MLLTSDISVYDTLLNKIIPKIILLNVSVVGLFQRIVLTHLHLCIKQYDANATDEHK